MAGAETSGSERIVKDEVMASVLTEGLEGPEGPVWMPDGTLCVTEMGRARITAIAPDGTTRSYADTGGTPNGVALGPGGALFVTNNGGSEAGYIQVISPQGAVEVLYPNCDGEPFLSPNDLAFDAHGGFYFTDPGPISREGIKFGHLYYALADGSLVKRLQHIFFHPNGLALTEDGSTLIVLESMTGRAWGLPVESPGTLGWVDAGPRSGRPRGRPEDAHVATVPGAGLPDGMCIDEAGNLLICAENAGFVSVHAADGTPIARLDAGDPKPTNCCFGGDDYRTLYVTGIGDGRVTTIEWERAGLRLPNY